MRTNSLPMKPAPPVTSRRTSDVLDGPVEADARIVPRDTTLVRIRWVVRLGDVIVEDHVAERHALIPVRHQRRNRDHPWRVLADHHRLDAARSRGVMAKVDQHDARVTLDDVPVVPLSLVPVERLDQLRRVAAARVGKTAGYLRERLVRNERPALVVEVASLQ